MVQVTGYGSRGERWIIDRYNITQSLRSDCDGESQRIDPASYPEDWDVLLTDVFHKKLAAGLRSFSTNATDGNGGGLRR